MFTFRGVFSYTAGKAICQRWPQAWRPKSRSSTPNPNLPTSHLVPTAEEKKDHCGLWEPSQHPARVSWEALPDAPCLIVVWLIIAFALVSVGVGLIPTGVLPAVLALVLVHAASMRVPVKYAKQV